MSEQPSTERWIYVETRVANQKKSLGTAFFLWFFLGFLGGHSFYLHRPWQGVTKIALLVAIVLLVPIFLLGLWMSVDFPLGSFLGQYYEYKEDSGEENKNWRGYGEQWKEYGEEWREYGEQWKEYGEEWREYGEQWKEYGEEWREYGEEWGELWREQFVFFLENFNPPWWFFPGILLWICLGLSVLIWWVVDLFLLSPRIEKDTQAKRDKLLKEIQTTE